MPQLMPLNWVYSILMSFFLLMMLMIMYNYTKNIIVFILHKINIMMFYIEW